MRRYTSLLSVDECETVQSLLSVDSETVYISTEC